MTQLLQLLHSGDRKQTYCALVALRKLTGKSAAAVHIVLAVLLVAD